MDPKASRKERALRACSLPSDQRAAVVETHISTIFLVGDRAYKLKKPVLMGFLDFSTREARKAACEREVELNRRFAPDVYLGVAGVTDPAGSICDHLVVMKRMPEDRRLSALVRNQIITIGDIERVGRTVVGFHEAAPTSAEMAKEGERDAVRERWEKNLHEIEPFVGTVVNAEDVATATLLLGRYLDGRKPLFDQRIAEGRIRDGHGDLLANDIYLLQDGPRVLDCLEFDDRLRYVDVIDDAAFLAMDLERLGAPKLARTLLDTYRRISGDPFPPSLGDHYIAYRALVRAKVACLRHAQGENSESSEANLLLRLSVEHLLAARVFLVLVGGLPGSGKSTLSTALAEACGWSVLHSDEVRKKLAGISPTTAAPAEFRHGIYTPEFTVATYSELLRRAQYLLEHGHSVIVDASWIDSRWREEAARIADSTSSDLAEFHFRVDPEVSNRRLRSRRRAGTSTSDATSAIAEEMARYEEGWPTATEVDTSEPRHRVLDRVLQGIGSRRT